MDEIVAADHYPKTREDLAKPPGEWATSWCYQQSFYLRKGSKADPTVEGRVDRNLWLRYCDIKRLNSIKSEILEEVRKKSLPWYRRLLNYVVK